jgi:hypothetical protein
MSDEEESSSSSSGEEEEENEQHKKPSPGWSPSKQRKINRELAANLASDPNRKPVSRYGRERIPSKWCTENEMSMMYSDSTK